MEDDLINDLFNEVQAELKERTPSEWQQIADATEGVSFSWVSKIAYGSYKSEPTYKRLAAVARYLKEHPRVVPVETKQQAARP